MTPLGSVAVVCGCLLQGVVLVAVVFLQCLVWTSRREGAQEMGLGHGLVWRVVPWFKDGEFC